MNLEMRTLINTTLGVTCLIMLFFYFIDVQTLEKISVLFNFRSEYHFPKQVSFCPDPKVVFDQLPINADRPNITADNLAWKIGSEGLKAPMTPLHMAKVEIHNESEIRCYYTWKAIPPDDEQTVILFMNQDQRNYKPAGFHWKDLGTPVTCRAIARESCPFSFLPKE